ncbi:hypothetical protein [Thermococcus sp.]
MNELRAITKSVVEKLTLLFMASASQLKEETSLNAVFPSYPEAGLHDFGNVEPVIIILWGEDALILEYFSKTAEFFLDFQRFTRTPRKVFEG